MHVFSIDFSLQDENSRTDERYGSKGIVERGAYSMIYPTQWKISGFATRQSTAGNVDVRFGSGTDTQIKEHRKKLKAILDQCVYCQDEFKAKSGKEAQLTFEHLRPDSAKGSAAISNAVLACSPCNQTRRSTPILEYLNGERRNFEYGKTSQTVSVIQADTENTANAAENARIKAAFSNYLRVFIEKRVSVHTTPASALSSTKQKATTVPWFTAVFDNLLYPFWNRGKPPQDEGRQHALYQERVKLFVQTMASADPGFWLGKTFETFVKESFSQKPVQRNALLNAIKKVRTKGVPTPPRFGADILYLSPLGRPAPFGLKASAKGVKN